MNDTKTPNSAEEEGITMWGVFNQHGKVTQAYTGKRLPQEGFQKISEDVRVGKFFTPEALRSHDAEIAERAFNAGRSIKIGYPDNTPETHYSFCDFNDYQRQQGAEDDLRAEGYVK